MGLALSSFASLGQIGKVHKNWSEIERNRKGLKMRHKKIISDDLLVLAV